MEYPSSIVKTFQVPRGYKYAFVHIASKDSKPTLLFLPGFPEAAFDWHHQVDYFKARGYGLIVPDLLGYGNTDKPKDYREYRMKSIAGDVVSILDHLQLREVVGIGHDWGAGVLAALSAYFPDRFLAYAFTAVGYNPPGRMQPDMVNQITKQMLGYEAFGYFAFFGTPDAAQYLDGNLDSVNSMLMSEEDPQHWIKNVCPPGAAQSWLEGRKALPLPGWLKKEDLEAKNRILSQGFTGPLNYYQQAMDPFNDEDAATVVVKGIPEKPVLFVADTKQAAMPSEMMEHGTRQHCKNLTVRKLNTSHWMMLEDPEALNQVLEEFLHDNGF
ncbi:putative epoxide hydrolase [Elsinoe ampelina]|uniref:Putative epoxide hydrolase n=1 Tax=Elsinoe ampelina TaxID=302913 RepID=A0A6A6GFG8_9PEZI|nr:putative epoxide hydrolase [Elsinoe ampelina]